MSPKSGPATPVRASSRLTNKGGGAIPPTPLKDPENSTLPPVIEADPPLTTTTTTTAAAAAAAATEATASNHPRTNRHPRQGGTKTL